MARPVGPFPCPEASFGAVGGRDSSPHHSHQGALDPFYTSLARAVMLGCTGAQGDAAQLMDGLREMADDGAVSVAAEFSRSPMSQ